MFHVVHDPLNELNVVGFFFDLTIHIKMKLPLQRVQTLHTLLFSTCHISVHYRYFDDHSSPRKELNRANGPFSGDI